VPVLLWPSDWAVGVNDNIEFLVDLGSDYESDPFVYDYEWCTSSTFSSTYGQLIQRYGESGNYSDMDIDFLRATIYYWRARSRQSDNNSTQGWSLTGHFQTDFNSTSTGSTGTTTNNTYQTISSLSQNYNVYDQETVEYYDKLAHVEGFMDWIELELNSLHLKFRFGPIIIARWTFYLILGIILFGLYRGIKKIF
jgi:hypothetical protein